MTALAANPTVPVKKQTRAKTKAHVIATSEIIYDSALVDLDSSGDLVAHSDTTGRRFMGVSEKGPITGDQTADVPPRATVRDDGPTLEGVDVAGVDDYDDLMKLVWCADDNTATLSLTPSVSAGPVGRLIGYRSASDMDVRIFTPTEAAAMMEGGFSLWSHDVNLDTVVAGDIITTMTPGFAGRIVKVWAVVTEVVTTASDAASINWEIGTTNLTGGVIALTSANATPLGATIDGSAITAANWFSATDTLSVEGASVTDFAEGRVTIYASLQSFGAA